MITKMIDIQSIKQRYGIIGNSPAIDRAINIAIQVAATDLTVLINGESGVGKEHFPRIIHDNSAERKFKTYTAINCGAIPEGTIDSELFGHEKGSFTGANEARKGYFEQSDGGTIFLDEVAELPLATQVRLLRVLETGDFIRVGSSKVQKTNVRVVAATNVDIPKAISKGKFREDLYYRLNTVPIQVPPLRERKEDILLLFMKFALDFSEKYRMPVLELNPEAKEALTKFYWPGNVRQLKNITEQISILEKERLITPETLNKYINIDHNEFLPVIYKHKTEHTSESAIFERELIFKFLGDMQKDINDLKHLVSHLSKNQAQTFKTQDKKALIFDAETNKTEDAIELTEYYDDFEKAEEISDNLLLQEKEKELIVKALIKNNGKRKDTAKDLGISERTLYRKLKVYNLVD
ncbi:MAG: sigma-54 dependent transcriptional regulator [Bacteroidales bacterium]|nr:sigma-54 dependent transcriptional regulator [Bacteroidales bacterium]MDD4209036.1 sigma-54 dependent transcriptional regulator [Bacteroidales bacterium]